VRLSVCICLLSYACNSNLTNHTLTHGFYRAKRSVARYCHDKLSVRPSVCNVGGLWSHALEFF